MLAHFLLIFVVAVSAGFSQTASAKSEHDAHRKGETQIRAKIVRIVDYENGMSLVLDREIEPNVTCVHLENAASFSKRKLEKLAEAKETNLTISLKIVDGHVVDIL